MYLYAIGSSYDKFKIRSCKHSEMTVFSFNAVKVITTGEGGCITTNSKKLYEKILLLRLHGITKNKHNFFKNLKINFLGIMNK